MTVTVNFLGRSIGLGSKQSFNQTPDEKVQYVLNVGNFSTTVSGTPVVSKVVDIEAIDTDVKGTVVGTQAVSVSGTLITLPTLESLTIGKSYRVHVTHVNGGNTEETYENHFIVRCRVE